MKDYIKTFSIIILISILIVYVCYIIESNSIFNYLYENLLTILIGFLAINTATLGHLAAKIQDIMIIHKELDFENTTFEMKKSLFEQIIMICCTSIVIIVQKSNLEFLLKSEFLSTILIAIFIYAIYVIWDTGKSVFVVIDEIRKINKQ